MALTYSELDRLQKELIAAADADARTDEQLLRQVALGSRGMRDPVVAQLAAKVAARLLDHHGNQLVRQLCRGALVAVLDGRHEAREVLPFAAQLVHRASHASPSPASLALPETAAAKAREHFETFLAEPGRIDALTAAAHKFVLENDSMAGGVLFARFMTDSEFLGRVVCDEARSDEERKTAAGALRYFVEARDAITDDLGVAGILDDAYIAQLAAERIAPSRRTKTRAVDALLTQWPFLARLRITFERDELSRSEWSPSEFALLNLAAGFSPGVAARSAIVLPHVDVLPMCLGLLASLGVLYDSVERGAASFRPHVGDFVAVADHDDEAIEVLGYFQPPGGHHNDPAPPESARLVKLRYRPRSKKSGAAPVEQSRPIQFLDVCVPSSARGGRRTTLPRSRGDVDLGPLERLFGTDRPLRLEQIERRIIVVTTLKGGRDLLATANVFGRPLVELIPCGRALPEAGYEIEWWSPRRPGNVPLLMVARDLPEAAAIVARHGPDDNTSVVVGLDKHDWDAAALAQLGGARVVSIVPQWQLDAQDVLAKQGYRFFDWTKDLETSVARGPSAASTNVIDDYERATRRQLCAEVHVHAVDLQSIEVGLASLKALSDSLRREYDDEIPGSLAKWALSAQQLFFELNATPIRISDEAVSRTGAALDGLLLQFGKAKHFWSEQCAALAKSEIEALHAILHDLKQANPKEKALEELLTRPETTVRCSSRQWPALRARFPNVVPWTDDDATGRKPAVIFHWPGWKQLPRWILPPIGSPTHVVFYRWERDGLRRAQSLRSERLARHWTEASRSRVWETELTASESSPTASEAQSPIANLEDWVAGLQRQGVVSSASPGSEDDPSVEAVAVYFAGARYALYTRTFDVHVATNVNSLSKRGEERLQERAASSLRVGDVVVVRAGAERDAIRNGADSQLPKGARELARTWHGALHRMRERLPSDRAVHRALSTVGCTKAEITVIGWLRSLDQIGPHDDADVDFIAKASSDPILVSKIEECKAAIHRVRREHHRASHELFVRALEEVRTRLHRGQALDDAIDLGDRIELLIVEAVDEKPVFIARSATNHPRQLL